MLVEPYPVISVLSPGISELTGLKAHGSAQLSSVNLKPVTKLNCNLSPKLT